MNSKLTTTKTQDKNPENTSLKFLTPLTTSVEKFVNLHGLNKFINQEI
jgi:hypothetical protein